MTTLYRKDRLLKGAFKSLRWRVRNITRPG
jgi:hypothetical protein